MDEHPSIVQNSLLCCRVWSLEEAHAIIMKDRYLISERDNYEKK